MGLNLHYREFLAILTSSIYHMPATMEPCAADTDVRVIIRNSTVRMNSTIFAVVSSLEAMRIHRGYLKIGNESRECPKQLPVEAATRTVVLHEW